MDAAFINLDGENYGLLHNRDIRLKQSKGVIKKGGDEPIGKMLKPGQMVLVQAKSTSLKDENTLNLTEEKKSATLSMDITFQGRFLIYAPFTEENRLSKRIKDRKIRRQLLKMLDQMQEISGFILRASATGTQTEILARESGILKAMWSQLQGFAKGDAPQLIMLGPDAVHRALSDQAAEQIARIEVVTMERFQQVEEWCELYAPELVTRIKPVELDNPYDGLALFDHHDLLEPIQKLDKPYIMMPEGSNLIIEETAALTAIDINRGTDTRSNLEINLSAAREAARQTRLRNLGGILMIDFLKMKSKRDEGQLIAALETAFGEDPCTVQIHGITALGLIEATRARKTAPLNMQIQQF